MFRPDTDADATPTASPGGWAAPGSDRLGDGPWPARGGFLTGGPLAPFRPGASPPASFGDHPDAAHGFQAARLDEDDDFEEDFLDDEDDDDDDEVFDDEVDDDDDDLLDEDDDEEFDFEDD